MNSPTSPTPNASRRTIGSLGATGRLFAGIIVVGIFLRSMYVSDLTPTTQSDAPIPSSEKSEKDQLQGDPVLGIERFEHDFGEIWDLEKHETTFGFENKGESPLIIEEVKASCGCTTPTLTKTTYVRVVS